MNATEQQIEKYMKACKLLGYSATNSIEQNYRLSLIRSKVSLPGSPLKYRVAIEVIAETYRNACQG